MIFFYPILALLLFLIYNFVPAGYSGFLSVFIEWLTTKWIEPSSIILVIGIGVCIIGFMDIYHNGHRVRTSYIMVALTLNTIIFILDLFFLLRPIIVR